MRHRAISVILAAAMITGLTGCTFFAPQTVEKAYDPSDGVSGNVGDVELRNALMVTKDGTDANLVVSTINTGDRNVRLVVSWDNSSGTRIDRNVYLKAGGARTYGSESNMFVLGDIEAAPGSLFQVYFQYGDNPGDQLAVPVLDGTLPEYAKLVPAS